VTQRTARGERFQRTVCIVLLVLSAVTVLNWGNVLPVLRGLASQLYVYGGNLYALVGHPLNAMRLALGTNPFAPLLLGIMGATAPCQVSTGAVSLAYVARDRRDGGALQRALAYTAARVLFYGVVGGAVVVLLGGTVQAPGEFFTGVRRVLGPLTLLAGLVTLGVIRLRFQVGDALGARVQNFGEARGGLVGAFALGLAFSLAFCPTLFLLFFGATLPLAAQSPLGLMFPALFALGMSLPILMLAALVPGGEPRRGAMRVLRGWHRFATPVAGTVFVLVGVYDVFVYWSL
jgi:cytochrome c biogenesis protein CcdA